MIITDQIGDMLTRIRNATIVRHETVEMPASKLKVAILRILKEEGFIGDFEVIKAKPEKLIRIRLKYSDDNRSIISGIERVSKPGLRVYAQHNEIPRVYGGVGIAVLSTPKGVTTGQIARRNGVGGEVLCYVW
ncbi:MAG TPA: 30S ribosomal protein S8 [Dehalococcoidales bacterium]|nr:30S ribosomal protein S8 [Dehalococcoidales bacterium]